MIIQFTAKYEIKGATPATIKTDIINTSITSRATSMLIPKTIKKNLIPFPYLKFTAVICNKN